MHQGADLNCLLLSSSMSVHSPRHRSLSVLSSLCCCCHEQRHSRGLSQPQVTLAYSCLGLAPNSAVGTCASRVKNQELLPCNGRGKLGATDLSAARSPLRKIYGAERQPLWAIAPLPSAPFCTSMVNSCQALAAGKTYSQDHVSF